MTQRGRPRKSANERKENRIDVRLNDFWVKELLIFAQENDLPPATAARMLLVGKLQELKSDDMMMA